MEWIDKLKQKGVSRVCAEEGLFLSAYEGPMLKLMVHMVEDGKDNNNVVCTRRRIPGTMEHSQNLKYKI